MENLVSVIMPVYNVENYIVKSIQSVLNQTYNNFELLIINDGTLDNSIEKVKYFDDQRIKIIHKQNGGLSDARNTGIASAQGDYLYFIDSDDWIEPNLLELAVASILKNNADFVLFGYYLDNEDAKQNLLNSKKVVQDNVAFIRDNSNFELQENTLNLLGYAWNKVYKTSLIKQNKLFFDKGISLVEDMLFNSKVYSIASQIVFIDKALYHYIERPVASLIKNFHPNSFQLILFKIKAIDKFLTSWKIDDNVKNQTIAQSLIIGIRYCVNNLFAFKNNLSFKEKYNYLKMMLNNPETKKYIYFYDVNTLTDKFYKFLIQSRASLLLYLFCKIKK